MSNKNKSSVGLKIFAITELLIILALMCLLVWIFFIKENGETSFTERAVPTIAEAEDPEVRTRAVIDKEETFYQVNGKKILINDGTYGEIFMPIFEDVPASTLDNDAIVTRNGYSFYKENDEITSITGIDISEHQGEVDWEQVKNAGIEFAFIRVGYRTYGGGDIVFDEHFRNNIEAADRAGIKVGVYFFSQAVTEDEAIEEADAVIDAIQGFNITYPVVYDWEIIYGDNARTDTVTVEELADMCTVFCERIRSAGYKPMIYQNKGTSLYKLDLPRLKDYDFWLAEYADEPSYYYEFKIWQYASDGKVPGVSGEVDMNISFVDYSE